MTDLTNEEIEFLIGMAQCLIDYGMVNHTYEDYKKLKEIREKYAEQESKTKS